MKPIDLPKGAIAKVVQAEEVEGATKDGWSIVGTVEVEALEMYSEQEQKLPPPTSNGGYYNPGETIFMTKHKALKSERFVLVKDEESALCKLREELANKDRAIADANDKAKDLEKREKDLLKQIEELKAWNAKTEETYREASRQRDLYKNANEQLSFEKQKFVKALGEIGVEQILKGEKFTGEVVLVSPDEQTQPSRFERSVGE